MALPLRVQALNHAKRDIGVTEHPADSNWGPRVSVYLRSAGITFPAPWCAAFVTYHLRAVGYDVTTPGPASVENWVQWAAKHGDIVTRPFKGDLICYDWDANNWYDHIGFVDKVLAIRGRTYYVRTVEGNTSVGNDSNGGKVMYRWRWVGRNVKFLRLK